MTSATQTLAVAQFRARPGCIAESVAAHARIAVAAADVGAKLLVFPELSLTGYSRELTTSDAIGVGEHVLRPIADVSRTERMTVVAGAPLASPSGLLIASLVFYPDGRIGTYTKQHLHDGEEQTFTAGDGGALLSVDDHRVALAICADINHASHVADAVARGASAYATSCFFTPNGYESDCQRLASYATSHRVIVLMANFTGSCGGFTSAGGSAIWDDGGQRLAVAPAVGEYLVVAERQGAGWVGHLAEVGV